MMLHVNVSHSIYGDDMALNKRKITLCWPNYIGEAALSGGSWEADLPLAHIQNAVFAVRARSTDLSSTSTRPLTPRTVPVATVSGTGARRRSSPYSKS